MSRSRSLDELRQEDSQLALQLERVKPQRPRKQQQPSQQDDEVKAESRRLRSRIAYKKRQLAKLGQEGHALPAPAKRAPAKRALPMPPAYKKQVQQGRGQQQEPEDEQGEEDDYEDEEDQGGVGGN